MPGIVGAALAGMSTATRYSGGIPHVMRSLRARVRRITRFLHGTTTGHTAGAGAIEATVQRARWTSPTTRHHLEYRNAQRGRTVHRSGRATIRMATGTRSSAGRTVRLLVDVRTKGMGASWARHHRTGDVDLELPYGRESSRQTMTPPRPGTAPAFHRNRDGHRPFSQRSRLAGDDDTRRRMLTDGRRPDGNRAGTLPRLIRCVSREAAPGVSRAYHRLPEPGASIPRPRTTCAAPAHIVRDFAHHPGRRRTRHETFLTRPLPRTQRARTAPRPASSISRMTITSSSAQSSVRVTALFHQAVRAVRSASSMDGVQRLPSTQLARSVLGALRPVAHRAMPAAYAAPGRSSR